MLTAWLKAVTVQMVKINGTKGFRGKDGDARL